MEINSKYLYNNLFAWGSNVVVWGGGMGRGSIINLNMFFSWEAAWISKKFKTKTKGANSKAAAPMTSEQWQSECCYSWQIPCK